MKTTTENLYSHPYYQLEMLDEDILAFRWVPGNEDITYEDFQESCMNYLGFAFECSPKYLLVDTREFAGQMHEEFEEWRKRVLYPRYEKAGIVKKAYFMQPETLEYVPKGEYSEGGFSFTIRHFADEGCAVAWLRG